MPTQVQAFAVQGEEDAGGDRFNSDETDKDAITYFSTNAITQFDNTSLLVNTC